MKPQAIRARRSVSGVVLLAIVVSAGACGGRFERELSEPRPALLRIDYPAGASRKVLAEVRSVAGVANVAAMSLVDARAFAGSSSSSVKLAVVDPREFGPIASSSTTSLRAGALLLAPASLQELGVVAGGVVKLRDDDGPSHSIVVGALPPELTITGASGIVDRARVSWITAGKPTMLVVGVTPDADPNATASALASSLNAGVGVGAQGPNVSSGRASSTLFGTFSYLVNADGTIRQDPSWVRRYIVSARVPVFGSVTCHRMMIPQLAAALGEVQRLGLASAIDRTQYGGCYVARKILWDPANPVSMHAWGLAIDINVSTNGYGARPQLDPRVVRVFERWGFRWGGRWKTPDGMHFELAALIRR